jgi:RNA polymerase sigma-70 factor (ECF subfamily)
MDIETFRQLRRQAAGLARSTADADDLVQDALLAALQAGRSDIAWLSGVMRNQAAMHVRSAMRRRRREQDAANVEIAGEAPSPGADPGELLKRLPPSARRVATLALHGLAADEIRWILVVSPAAFRQRLTTIRKALGALPPELQSEALALAYVRDPARSVDLQFGLVRRALKAALGGLPGLATHDADGHLLVIRSDAHTLALRGND